MSEQLESVQDTVEPAEVVCVPPQSQVGEQLRLAREARGLSVIDIAQALKLGARQVDALESGEWDILPGNTFVRGFIRNYARIVELDSAPLMSALDTVLVKPISNLAVNQQSLSQMPSAGSFSAGRDRFVVFAGLLLVILAALAYFLLANNLSSWRDGLQELLDSVARKDEVVAVTVLPAPAEPVFPPGTTPQQIMNPQTLPTSAVEVSVTAPATETISPAVVPGVVEKSPTVEAPAPQIRFTVEKESWLEIRDRDNKPIFSQRVLPGETQNLKGDGPFSVVVGFAPGVKIFWHGQLVNLAPHTRGDVARLVLE